MIERRCHEDRYEMFRSLTLRYRVLDRQTGLSYALPQSTQVNFQPATVLANGQIASFQSPVTIGSNYTLVLHTPGIGIATAIALGSLYPFLVGERYVICGEAEGKISWRICKPINRPLSGASDM